MGRLGGWGIVPLSKSGKKMCIAKKKADGYSQHHIGSCNTRKTGIRPTNMEVTRRTGGIIQQTSGWAPRIDIHTEIYMDSAN